MANGKQKKSKKKLYIFGGLGVLLLALVAIVIFQGNKEEIINVQTEKITKRTITQTVSATGKINPEFKVVITPEVTGEIVQLPVKEGQVVKKGELLIKIKADAYVAQKQRSEASLLSAKSSLAQRKAELDKITSDYNRMKELHAKKLSSDADLETAKSNYLSTAAGYEALKANVLQSEASLKETIESLNKTTIYSPMAGVITQLNVELGERVLGSGFSQGTDIMTVSDLTSMEARVDVDENDVVLISVGDTAYIKVDAFGDKDIKGVVTQIGNSAKTSGLGSQEQVVNFEVRIRVTNLENNLRPGMSCNADIRTETVENVLSVPLQSVTARGDFNMPKEDGAEESMAKVVEKKSNGNKPEEIVFIVENGKAKSKKVKTGLSDDNYIEVKEGLKGGEEVVNGSYRAISRDLKDGSLVKVEGKKKSFTEKKN
ncbi:MAG: efflux RND transporter periplasmic adaptor subunit [Ignavibacteriaceae bacterium]|jgi:HlyD family secretion protein|nr:efflux RND transporter periplasmic adaptor subunit [Ignavibacteriaceae bacterium]